MSFSSAEQDHKPQPRHGKVSRGKPKGDEDSEQASSLSEVFTRCLIESLPKDGHQSQFQSLGLAYAELSRRYVRGILS